MLMIRKKNIRLSELPFDIPAVITKLPDDNKLRFALLRLGISEQTIIRRLLSSPFGDPNTYICRGTLISIRNNDAGKISVITEVSDETKIQNTSCRKS